MSTVATPAKRGKKKTKKPAGAAPSPEVKQYLRQLEEHRKLGEAIQEKDAERAKQETVCAEVKSRLESEREDLHAIERVLEELKDDLTKLAVGGFPERLPFGAAPVAGDAKPDAPTPAKADDDAWRAVPLADAFAKVKANPALLALLADGKIKRGPGQGNVAGIRTLGEVVDFTNGDRKLTDIGGLGEAKATLIADALADYWAKVAEEKQAAPAVDAATPAAASASAIFTCAALSIDPGKVEAACHPHLLATIGNDRTANAHELIEYDGRQYVVTPAPAPHDPDVYAMREVIKGEAHDLQKDADDPYCGGQILVAGEAYTIGSRAKMILVRDGGAAKSGVVGDAAPAEADAEPARKPKAKKRAAAKGKGKRK